MQEAVQWLIKRVRQLHGNKPHEPLEDEPPAVRELALGKTPPEPPKPAPKAAQAAPQAKQDDSNKAGDK